jgi:Tfp pilus assembly protein PilZ
MNWKGTDRRQFPRVMYPCMVKIISSNKEQELMLTHTENIGQGGLCVIVKKEIELFAPVAMEVDLLDISDHLHLKGKVVWKARRKPEEKVKPLFYSIGIEFTQMSQADHDHLQQNLQMLIKNGTELSKPYI